MGFFKKGLFVDMPRSRLTAGLLLSVVVLIGVLFCDSETARGVIRYFGYYFTIFVFVLFFALLVQMGMLRRGGRVLPSTWGYGACLVICGSWLLFVHADFGYKIAMDDYVLASTARNLHETRECVATTRVEAYGNAYVSAVSSVDKRPWLYPFLVSVLHDLFGFRSVHPFLLDAALGVGVLVLAYALGAAVAGVRGGALSLLLWVSLPLLAQNATGGGMEMLNLFLLQAVLLCSFWYLRRPCRDLEGLLSLLAVLLAYSRYESMLFLPAVLCIIVLGWARAKRCYLSWASIVAIPLMLGVLLQIKVYMGNEAGWELAQGASSAFDLKHLFINAPHALNFFFNQDDVLANSLLLSVWGSVAFVGSILLMCRELRRSSPSRAVILVFIVFAPFLVMSLLVMLCFHAGRLDSPFVSRYSLPFHALLVIACVVVQDHIARHWPRARLWSLAYVLVLGFILTFTLPMNAKAVFSRKNFAVNEQYWLEDLSVGGLQRDGLVIDTFELPWAYRNWTTLSPEGAVRAGLSAVQQVRIGKYSAIYLVERLIYRDGAFVPLRPETAALHQRFDMQTVAERSFRPFTLTRVMRVTEVRDGQLLE